jgi:hypothetical protein
MSSVARLLRLGLLLAPCPLLLASATRQTTNAMNAIDVTDVSNATNAMNAINAPTLKKAENNP